MNQSRLTSSAMIMIIPLAVAAGGMPAQPEAVPRRAGGGVAAGSVIVETRSDERIALTEALAAWSAAIDLVDRHGHAFVSSGPRLLDRVSPFPPAFELARFGDYRAAPRYPAGGPSPRLDRAAEGFELEVRGSGLELPEARTEAAPSGTRVRVRQVGGDGELLKEALPVGEGICRARFAAGELAGLGPGAAFVLVEASVGGSLPVLGIAEILVVP